MPEAPHQDDRKLIPIWIREENARRQLPEPQRAISLEVEEQLRGLATEPAGGAQQRQELEARARKLLATGVPPVEASTGRVKLPTQFEREQAIMRVRQGLGSGRSLLGPNAMQVRDDIFAPRRQGESDLGSGLNDREGNPDVNRVEPWSIWAYVISQSGGSTDWSSLYWRYRIWVPSSFPACDASWFLNVTPRAVLTGRYDLFAMNFFGVATTEVVLRFWTGTWHWRYSAGSWTPTWSGWRPSYNVVDHAVSGWGNVSQLINVGYPGTDVRTPAEIPPPGVSIQPNPVNDYGIVAPTDVVDFYVRPELRATTAGLASFAKLDLSLIDVPFVVVDYQCHGFYL